MIFVPQQHLYNPENSLVRIFWSTTMLWYLPVHPGSYRIL